MTQAQYDAAKDIVLDLLGWGVPPDYLVSCGVSREIMFYVFTELNLRLPSNFDATGIPPYPPVPADFTTTPTSNVVRRFDSMTLRSANGGASMWNHLCDYISLLIYHRRCEWPRDVIGDSCYLRSGFSFILHRLSQPRRYGTAAQARAIGS